MGSKAQRLIERQIRVGKGRVNEYRTPKAIYGRSGDPAEVDLIQSNHLMFPSKIYSIRGMQDGVLIEFEDDVDARQVKQLLDKLGRGSGLYPWETEQRDDFTVLAYVVK